MYINLKLEFQRTYTLCALNMHFQGTARAAILHCSYWHSAMHELSNPSGLMEAEPEMPLHTCIDNISVVIITQELKHSLKHTTSTTADSTSYRSLD